MFWQPLAACLNQLSANNRSFCWQSFVYLPGYKRLFIYLYLLRPGRWCYYRRQKKPPDSWRVQK
jgi:hypothetical protein